MCALCLCPIPKDHQGNIQACPKQGLCHCLLVCRLMPRQCCGALSPHHQFSHHAVAFSTLAGHTLVVDVRRRELICTYPCRDYVYLDAFDRAVQVRTWRIFTVVGTCACVPTVI